MKTSVAGLALIEQFEGLRLASYQDGAGIWTIGYGHTVDVFKGDTCTAEQAAEWLIEDVVEAEDLVNSLVNVPMTQNQFDALVSFTFNLGGKAFANSTLLRVLNAGSYALVGSQFLRWDDVAGKPSPGLLRRREAERELFVQA